MASVVLRQMAVLLGGLAWTACGASGPLSQLRGDTPPPTPAPAPSATSCPDALGDATLAGKAAQVVTHGSVTTTTAGTISYTATAGYLPLYAAGQQSGTVRACMFYFAYTRDDKASDTSWPVAFAFNGGPGSASDWMHLGGNGPKALDLGPDGLNTAARTVGDDPETLLAATDLVFIDPINTGYSRAAAGVDGSVYDGLTADADSIGDFIQGYVTATSRLPSPKLLIGESYAGMRIPVLGRYLDETLKLKLAGTVFVSPWLDAMGDDTTDVADDIPYVTSVPEFATTAWYHQKLAPAWQAKSLAEVYAAAEQFASTTYVEALAQGDDLDDAQKAAVAQQLSDFSSLPAASFVSANLRITGDEFRAALLADQKLTVSVYDGRLGAVLKDPANDDAYDAFNDVFTSADSSYFGQTLKVVTDLPYVGDYNFKSWPGANPTGSEAGGYLNVLSDLTTLMQNNPTLKVMIAGGYYDFTCPPAEVKYMARHLPASVESRLETHLYPGGHPVYFGGVAHAQFTADVTALIAEATKAGTLN